MAKTTCDWTVERLPWWANGTLEGAEAERVEEHLDECAECRDELAATRRAMALYSVHLPVETLLDLVDDEAAESFRTADGAELSRVAVEEHLGHCPSCREELALLRESRAAVEAEPGDATVTAFAPRPAAPAAPARRGRSLQRRSLALAASLLLFVVAAGGWLATGMTAERRADRIAELERRLEEATAAAPAAEPVEEPTAADEATEEARAALAAAAARETAQAAMIVELRAELERLRAAAEGGERLAEAARFGRAVPWHLLPVTRGEADRPAEQVVDVAGDEPVSLVVSGIPDRPLRLVVEDAAGRRLLVHDDLEVFEDPQLKRHFMFSPADLPGGDLRLRLFAGGEEIGSLLLRVAP